MPINPITLDKKEPIIIRQIEQKLVDRVVHEAKQAEAGQRHEGNKQGFNQSHQEREAQRLGKYLEGFRLKLDYQFKRDKIKVRIIDNKGNLLIETEIDDIARLHSAIKKETGAIIDMKG